MINFKVNDFVYIPASTRIIKKIYEANTIVHTHFLTKKPLITILLEYVSDNNFLINGGGKKAFKILYKNDGEYYVFEKYLYPIND